MAIRMRLRRAVMAAAMLAATPVLGQGTPARGASDTASLPLETRVRQRIATVVKARLGLTDEQMRQLAAVNGRIEPRRRDLLARERQARVAVRAELRRGPSADQERIASALDTLFRLQRERIDVAEEEQHELAKFMRPSQRAGYVALQEQLRRRIEEMRRKREGTGPRASAQGR